MYVLEKAIQNPMARETSALMFIIINKKCQKWSQNFESIYWILGFLIDTFISQHKLSPYCEEIVKLEILPVTLFSIGFLKWTDSMWGGWRGGVRRVWISLYTVDKIKQGTLLVMFCLKGKIRFVFALAAPGGRPNFTETLTIL